MQCCRHNDDESSFSGRPDPQYRTPVDLILDDDDDEEDDDEDDFDGDDYDITFKNSLLRTAPEIIILSSTSGAAKFHGGSLGQYCLVPNKGWAVQRNTEKGDEQYLPRFIYRMPEDGWWIGNTPGKNSGWLRNATLSDTPPMTGWMYIFKNKWYEDPSLVITSLTPPWSADLMSLCDTITMAAWGPAAREQTACLGDFYRMREMWWNGRPVFRNSFGRLLHQSHNQGWFVGTEFGKTNLSGFTAYHCPADEKNWEYWDGSKHEHLPAIVKLHCNVHST